MVEGVQHGCLKAEIDALRDRDVLGNGKVIIHVSRTVEVHKLSEGSGRGIRLDVSRIRATTRVGTGGNSKVLWIQERHGWCFRNVVHTYGALEL